MNLGDHSGVPDVLTRPPKTRWPVKPLEKRCQAAIQPHYPPSNISLGWCRLTSATTTAVPTLRKTSEQNHVEFFSLGRNSTFGRIIPLKPKTHYSKRSLNILYRVYQPCLFPLLPYWHCSPRVNLSRYKPHLSY